MGDVKECSEIEFLESGDARVPECNYFAYDDSFTERFKNFARIEKLLLATNNDYEKTKIITDWVHNQWEHNGINEPTVAEPIQILTEARQGKKFRCVEYSIVLHAALGCYGIKSRVLGLRTSDVETRQLGAGHVVVESYLESLGKWVLFDPQLNVHAKKNGVPLNAVELQHELLSSFKDVKMYILNSLLDNGFKEEYSDWLCKYLYYFHTDKQSVFPPKYPRYQVVLMPIDAKIPTKFQGSPIKENLLPTNSYKAFYPGQKAFSWQYSRGKTIS